MHKSDRNERLPQNVYPKENIGSVRFGVFTTTEILRLSVKEITQTTTFDELGHPVPNGLYDPILGPIESSDRCQTCTLISSFCPGHLGHIQLPLPAFNSVLFDLTVAILKGSCVFCHRLFCSKQVVAVELFLGQLRLVEENLLVEAANLPFTVGKPEEQGTGNIVAQITDILDRVYKADKMKIRQRNDIGLVEKQLNRNATQARTKLVHEFRKNFLHKPRAKCPHCNERQPTIRNEFSRIIALDFTKAAAMHKKNMEIFVAGSKENEVPDIDIPLPDAAVEEENDLNDFLNEALGKKKKTKKTKQQKDEDLQKEADQLMKTFSSISQTIGNRLGIEEQLDSVRRGDVKQMLWGASEVRDHFRLLWERETNLLINIFPMFREAVQELETQSKNGVFEQTFGIQVSKMRAIDVLFFEVLTIPANKFRPPQFMNGTKYENQQTAGFRKVMEEAELVSAVLRLIEGKLDTRQLIAMKEVVQAKLPKIQENGARLRMAFCQMQSKINAVFDSDLDKLDKNAGQGIRQLLEKKEGLFRKHMMGKRVNYAARTVITPDPFLAVDEIGVPSVFAKRLTFGEYVNDINLPYMRTLIKAGPNSNPGANFFIDEGGYKQILDPNDRGQRSACAKRLCASFPGSLVPPKMVLRQLTSGIDIMLMNRQPTLHKPSIMGHRVKVLGYQKAFRMNYAPCKAYNADFDGDEMNGHYAQNHVARAEAFEIMLARKQYLVPKDGTPILGLIQDHIISGVLLTLRDTFFTRADYNHLVLNSFPARNKRFKTLPPTILKPQRLWTGKQVQIKTYFLFSVFLKDF